jgi:hypothetical protein
MIFLPQPPKFWDYRHEPPHLSDEGSNFSTFLSIVIFCFYDSSHLNGCEIIISSSVSPFPSEMYSLPSKSQLRHEQDR